MIEGLMLSLFNPLTGGMPEFAPIDIVDIYTEVKWYFPKIKSGQLLAVPLLTLYDHAICFQCEW
jgi:hypothetical protein